MERLAAALERFSAHLDNVVSFFDGLGMVILQMFGMLIVFVLFSFLVPRNFRQLLKWSCMMGAVTYVAQWLASK